METLIMAFLRLLDQQLLVLCISTLLSQSYSLFFIGVSEHLKDSLIEDSHRINIEQKQLQSKVM